MRFCGLFSRKKRPKGNLAAPPAASPPAPVPALDPEETDIDRYGLIKIYPRDESPTYEVDIVAVHGLNGNWKGTWTADRKMWLKDFLPTDFPKARIWSFGYDSNIFGRTDTDIRAAAESLISSLAGERRGPASRRKPIIFIAHSLGGIIVKKGLIIAHEQREQWESSADVLDNTTGILFFGVPHRGANIAVWGSMLTNLSKAMSLNLYGNGNFVGSLEPKSQEFYDISEAFVGRAAKVAQIRSFRESDRTGNVMIVDKHSATIGVLHERAVQLPGTDHRTVCKFEAYESTNYRQVLNALRDMLDSTEADSRT